MKRKVTGRKNKNMRGGGVWKDRGIGREYKKGEEGEGR